MRPRGRSFWGGLALLAAAVSGAAAQQGPGPVRDRFAGPAVMAVRPFRFRVVTGAPYQATATAVTTQTLADGNRITRTSVFQVARDGQGRIRRVVRLGNIGPWPAHGEMIFITDPVRGIRYVINPARKTYAVLPYRRPIGNRRLWRSPRSLRGRGAWRQETQNLGRRRMDGVRVNGRRVITTIPAGAIGNQAAIQIISERWYSPALRTVVAARHEDPRFGTTIYRLGQIERADPPASLFVPPPGYRPQARRPGPPRGR